MFCFSAARYFTIPLRSIWSSDWSVKLESIFQTNRGLKITVVLNWISSNSLVWSDQKFYMRPLLIRWCSFLTVNFLKGKNKILNTRKIKQQRLENSRPKSWLYFFFWVFGFHLKFAHVCVSSEGYRIQ